MARASTKTRDTDQQRALLPVPKPIIEHHSKTVFPILSQWKERKTVPPVLLLTGPSGIGKRAMVYHIAQSLLCEKSGFSPASSDNSPGMDLFGGSLFGSEDSGSEVPINPGHPCGSCHNCQRALNGNWLDFVEISTTLSGDDSKVIKIEHFRNLKSTIGFGAFEGSFKITLIDEAEKMTTQAANSLLKILEEPPAGWIFFLTATDASLLLPTLVSRCQTVRLMPLPSSTISELLESTGDIPKDRHRIIGTLAQGSWNKAKTLASDEVWEKRAALFKFMEKPDATVNNLIDWAALDPANFELLLDLVEQLLSDLIQCSLTPDNPKLLNSDWHGTILTMAKKRASKLGSVSAARKSWLEKSERVFRARLEASAPLNRKLLVQDVLLPFMII